MKQLLSSLFERLVRRGTLAVTWPDSTASTFGGTSEPVAGLRLTDWRTVRRLALNPGLAFGEAYMDGTLQPEACSLYHLLDLVLLNASSGGQHPVLRLHKVVRELTRPFRQINDPNRAKQHVAHHYDLDSQLYSYFFGPGSAILVRLFSHRGRVSGRSPAREKAPYRR